jgi:bifunctional DNase/RNase
MMIELELVGVRIDLPANQPMVLLKERGGDRFLPIWIGSQEATAIALALQGMQSPRPLTHDLIVLLLETLGTRLEAVHVTALIDGTFYADLRLSTPTGPRIVSARPSDALALAARLGGIPLFGAEEVLDQAGLEMDVVEGGEDSADAEEEVRRFRRFLEDVGPEDFEDA